MSDNEATLEMKRPKLLLADDSISVRKVVELTFAEEGVDVFAVGDGESAMQKFIEIQPDIVMVDVNMPDPTGYQICEMIKQDESTKDIPVLLLVGSFEPFDTTEAERVGADGFLTKPFHSVRELVGKVTELLGTENGLPPQPVETTDIESLFTSSFAETYRAPDGGTTDMFLGDTGMDDELIETSPQDGRDPEANGGTEDTGLEATVQGYDWAAEPVTEVEEAAAGNGGFEDIYAPIGAVVDQFEPETMHAPVFEDEGTTEFERIVDDLEDTIEVEEPAAETAPEPESEPEPEPQPEPEPEPEQEPEHMSEPFGVTNGSTEVESLPVAEDPSSYEPSEEFINIIARRVVEKLSDKAVREIAREAVPRITEKLIREALDVDKKG